MQPASNDRQVFNHRSMFLYSRIYGTLLLKFQVISRLYRYNFMMSSYIPSRSLLVGLMKIILDFLLQMQLDLVFEILLTMKGHIIDDFMYKRKSDKSFFLAVRSIIKVFLNVKHILLETSATFLINLNS